jgi:hypothetical protein
VIERAVLHGLAQVLGLDGRRAFEIGNRARNFQDTIVGARRQAQGFDGGFQQLFSSLEIAQCWRISFGGICALAYSFFSPR